MGGMSGTSGISISNDKPEITVIYLLYNAARNVASLVESIRTQKHPDQPQQEDWLEVIFMDDASKDDTVACLNRALDAIGRPKNYKIVANPQNMGLSKTLNKAFGLARAPFGLTCHCDVIYSEDTYVSSMLGLMKSHPEAGAITGQPQSRQIDQLPFAEKLNLITNLQDIFPVETQDTLIPVGFAEGRCDVFRIDALKQVGFYDTRLRVAGEDQVLAAQLRAKGFKVYQAPQLFYHLSVSDEQDSFLKLLKHQRIFGRAHPYILIKTRGTSTGAIGSEAGANRASRTLLRVTQIMATLVYAWTLIALICGFAPAFYWAPLLAILFIKVKLFWRHFRALPLSPAEALAFFATQPPLDLSYTAGLFQGLWILARGTHTRPIT